MPRREQVKMKKNINCLEGFACPECGSIAPFKIDVITTALFYDEGTEEYDGADYHAQSRCQCVICNWTGMVKDFNPGA